MKKGYRSEGYNWEFDTQTGLFLRWGKTVEENPSWSPVGPEIFDVEVSTVCHQGCKFCYKGNTSQGHNMSARTLHNILQVLPLNVNQIAYGIGSIDGNPDLKRILEVTREENIVPNITINGSRMTPYWYDMLARNCGAVAVSHYSDDTCFNAIHELTKRGMTQVNIHKLLALETYENCLYLIKKVKEDPRAAKLNAIVFLGLKPKGPRNTYHILDDAKKFKHLINLAKEMKINIGMDSCSAPMAYKAYEGTNEEAMAKLYVEPCESGLFSFYANSQGIAFPCSFAEETPGWEKGLDILELARTRQDFLNNIWLHPRMNEWRTRLMNTVSKCGECIFRSDCRACPIYKVSKCM